MVKISVDIRVLLRGIVNWSGAASWTKTIPLTPISVINILYFNLKQKIVFTNNVGHIWFPVKNVLEKIIYKKPVILKHFLIL